MATYDVGDLATLSTSVRDSSGTLTDATVVLAVTKPDGTAVSPAPTVSHTGVGLYSATVSLTAAGVWSYTWTSSGAVQAVDSGQFTVADPAPPAYATLAQLKDNLSISDAVDDVKLARVLVTASRQIDEMTSRRFYLAPVATAITYNPTDRVARGPEGERFLVDDIGSTTGLVVEVGTTGGAYTTVTSYETWPDNAFTRGRPIDSLLQTLTWGLTWASRVRVTARWGWPSIPDQIAEATLLQAGRIFRRRLSPDGIAGHGDFGVVRIGHTDPDVPRLIAPFVRLLVA